MTLATEAKVGFRKGGVVELELQRTKADPEGERSPTELEGRRDEASRRSVVLKRGQVDE